MIGEETPLGVAMISSVFYPSVGGAQTHTLRLCRKLKERGVQVFVITRHYRGLERYEEVEGIATYRVGQGESGKAWAAISYVGEALRLLVAKRHQYQLIHSHQMISPMTIGLLARASSNKRLVVNPHRSGPLGDIGILTLRRPLTGRPRLAAARFLADAFVCISPAIADELREIGVEDERLWHIANGVDTGHFEPVTPDRRNELRRRLDLPSGPVVTFTGRLTPEKGLDIAIRAWPMVQQAVPEAHLVLVGEGEQREELESLAREVGLAKQVIFAGRSDDVAPHLQASDAFLLPSYAEGLPVALLEAMACGLPSVASDIDGNRQLIDDRVNGRLVPVGDPIAVAQGVIDLLNSPEAAGWGHGARKLVCEHYSLDRVADRYITMYRAITATPSREAARGRAQVGGPTGRENGT